MDNKIERLSLIASAGDIAPQRVIPHTAYQMEEINGGYQLYRLKLDEDRKLKVREKVGDPDAWDQTILLLEQELSRMFQ